MIMKNKKIYKILIIIVLTIFLTGCTKPLRTKNNKSITHPQTGQTLTANILCKPTNKKTIEIYQKNEKRLKKEYSVNYDKLPDCNKYKIMANGYEGIWTTFFVQPLAWVILKIGNIVKSYGLSLIITSLIIRLIVFPLTKKMAMQSELLKEAQKEMKRIEKKYENKTDQASMMKKSQEMSMVYKKHGINPMSSCLSSFIQIPLFFAFFEAINRTPAIFEETFLHLQLGTTPMVAMSKGNYIYIILVILIGITTYISFKMSSQDNAATQNMKNMPVMMTIMIVFMGIFMSAALGIYWITTNLFIIFQNILVKRSKKNGKI